MTASCTADASAAAPLTAERLVQALDAGRVLPHYHPRVDLRTGKVRGVEAVPCWIDPQRAEVSAACIVAAAERHRLIHRLTGAVVDRALAQLAHWRAQGLVLTLSVGLSPRLLRMPDLVETLGVLLARHGLPADQLVIGIAEAAVVAQDDVSLARLARLHARGVGLSIDGFGSGGATLPQLARIRFTELRIDRGLVQGAHRLPQRAARLLSLLQTARRLGRPAVADGIETIEDWRLLQALGCTAGQGSLVGRAMPGEALGDWYRAHASRLRGRPAAAVDAGPCHEEATP